MLVLCLWSVPVWVRGEVLDSNIEGLERLEGLDSLEILDRLDSLDILDSLEVLDKLDHLERLERLDSLENQVLLDSLERLARFETSDSLELPAPQETLAEKVADEFALPLKPVFKPNPTRALWLALVLPGGGQIYNRKYWKLPIVYGGFLGCYYALSWNNQMLRDYSQAYLDIMDADPDTKSYEKMLPMGYNISGRESQFQEIFKNKKNYYRRYRDMSIFAFIAVYAIAVIDAYVDAELSSFDISPDLSLHVTPAVISTGHQQRSTGLQLAHRGQGFGMALQLIF